MKRVLSNPWVRAGLLVAVVLVLGWLLQRLSGPLTPFAIALALAYFLNPVVNALERRFGRLVERWPRLGRVLSPRAAAVGVLCVAVLLVIVIALVVVVPTVYRQVAEAAANVPDYVQRVRAKVEPFIQRLNVQYPEQAEEVRRRLTEAARTYLPDLVVPITQGIRSAFSSVLSFVLTVLNLVIVPIFAIYLLFDMNRIQAGVAGLVPHRARPYVYSRVGQVGALLSAFVRGQITVCLILGCFYALALTACGVPMGIPVGFLVGFFNMIPFMSYALGLPLTLLLSWVDDQDPTRLLVVAVVFTFGQFVEGNFITPRIVGESLGLHAVVVMLAVLVGGSLFGFLGMFLALPVTAALSVFWDDLRAAYLRSDFFRRGAPES